MNKRIKKKRWKRNNIRIRFENLQMRLKQDGLGHIINYIKYKDGRFYLINKRINRIRRMKKLVCFLCLLVVGCGKYNNTESQPEIEPYIDPYFNSLIEKFEYDEARYNIKAKLSDGVSVIKFDDITDYPTALGECRYYNTTRAIIFKIEDKNLSFSQQYRLFLHEVGHCLFDFEHSNNPNDIMYTYYFFNVANAQQMEDAFFKQIKNEGK